MKHRGNEIYTHKLDTYSELY